MRPLAQLYGRLGYTFADEALIEAALTHRSAAKPHNERLEFLGDAVLDLVISDQLFHLETDADEGDLSRLRASLVRRESLAELAAGLELADFVRLGAGEQKSGGHRRTSVLADAFEAVIAAIYLDAGYQAAADWVLRVFDERLKKLPDAAELRDPKTRLQELLQSRGITLAVYEVSEVKGEAHARQFNVSCTVAELEVRATGSGTSRRRAEQDAAAAALDEILSRGQT